MWKVPLFNLNYDEREARAVAETIESGWLTMGPKTAAFEDAFSRYLGGAVSALAVSSCTAAIHLSLLAAGIGPGDEVIISGLSFVACLNVVTLVGATPVLADSCSLTDWNVSVKDIETKISSKTKAILVVHFAGYPCDVAALQCLSKRHRLLLIEDVAHAVGASVGGEKCGTFGDVSCFSFFTNKNLSVGEGGMVVTRHPDLAEKLRLLRSHGMTSLTVDRHNKRSLSYDVLVPGLNYRLDEIRSSLGLVQLEKLDTSNTCRGGNVSRYLALLAEKKGLVVPWPEVVENVTPAYHIFPILMPKGIPRKWLMERLRDRGIQTSLHYPAYNDFRAYHGALKGDVPVADEVSQRVLTLPLYATLKPEQIEAVCEALLQGIDEYDAHA